MDKLYDLFILACNKTIIQTSVILLITDIVFGVLRAIRFHEFNSSVGIDGIIRKVSMMCALIATSLFDHAVGLNLIAFVPEDILKILPLKTVGTTEIICLMYIAYEVVSILKNMALCGLPVKTLWSTVKKFMEKYTTELPDEDELADSEDEEM